MREKQRLVVYACLCGLLAGLAAWQGSGPEKAAAGEQAAAPEKVPPSGVHLGQSRVYVKVGKVRLGHEHAVEGWLKSGSLHLGATENAGQFVFDMTRFAADTAAARSYIGLEGTTPEDTQQAVTETMLGPAVLAAEKFPTATFQIQQAVRLGEPSARQLPQYQLSGQFTLHGVTRPLQIVADVEEKSGWLHVRGAFAILQTQFGIRPFTKAFGAVGVTDRLEIYGDLWIAPMPADGR